MKALWLQTAQLRDHFEYDCNANVTGSRRRVCLQAQAKRPLCDHVLWRWWIVDGRRSLCYELRVRLRRAAHIFLVIKYYKKLLILKITYLIIDFFTRYKIVETMATRFQHTLKVDSCFFNYTKNVLF